jgi:hypothetical protein
VSCDNYHPTHQAQLEYKWGGKYGGANCTPCSAGMTGQAHTCGALLFTGAQIRAASNEPIPDPKSPGLNLGQVDEALFKLSKGAIDLDTHYRYDFDDVRKRVTAGAQAILQIQRSVLVKRGEAYGNTFAGGHAITIGVDSIGVWFDDPLTGRHYTSWATLEAAAGALVLNDAGDICGFGKAYVSFSRDITLSYRVRFIPGLLFAYTFRDGRIWDRHRQRIKAPTGAPCKPIRLFAVHPNGPLAGTGSKRLAVLTAGYLSGQGVSDASPYVEVIAS